MSANSEKLSLSDSKRNFNLDFSKQKDIKSIMKTIPDEGTLEDNSQHIKSVKKKEPVRPTRVENNNP